MNIRNLAKKIAPLAVALSLTVPSTAFAAETNGDTNANVPSVEQTAEDSGIALYSTINPGDNYLGYVTVTRTNQAGGSAHVLKGRSIQVKPAWKAVDSTTSEVNLRIWIIDENTGEKVFDDLFTPSRDTDRRKDNDGYWYVESDWVYNKLTPGHSFRFYYDITTAAGSTPTGNVRQALCHIWFNLK